MRPCVSRPPTGASTTRRSSALDPMYDLAVIKLEGAKDLPTIDFASSSKLNVGDAAMAVGAPARPVEHRHDRHRQRAQPLDPDRLFGSPRIRASPTARRRPRTTARRVRSSSTSVRASRRRSRARRSRSPSSRPTPRSTRATPAAHSSTAKASSSASTSPSRRRVRPGQSGSIGVGFSIPSDIVKRITGELIENGVATHGLLGANVLPAASIEGSTTTGAYIEEAVAGRRRRGGGPPGGRRRRRVQRRADHRRDRPHGAGARRSPAAATASLTYVRGDVEKTTDVTLGTLGE